MGAHNVEELMIVDLLFFIAVVLACNMAPAFAPPTWSIIVLFSFQTNLPPWALVIAGALTAATGRLILALYTRRFSALIPLKTRENLLLAGKYFEDRRKFLVLGLAIISPLPSAQLFEAAGLINFPLKKLTLAFFSGRIVTYSIYAASAHRFKETDFAQTLLSGVSSPWFVITEILMLGGLVLLTKIDWKRRLLK